MDNKMNKKDEKELTSEELETANGGLGLIGYKTPGWKWDKKRNPLKPAEEPEEDEEEDY